MYYIFNKIDSYDEETGEFLGTVYKFNVKTKNKSKPRGNILVLSSPINYVAPEVIVAANGDLSLSENTVEKDKKELKAQKIKDAKEYMKGIDQHLDAATSNSKLKEVVRQLVRLLE